MKIEFESKINNLLKNKYRLRMDVASFSHDYIPKHILLDSTRNIHSYFIFCQINKGELYSMYWDSSNIKRNIIKLLRTEYSQLGRPLFFVLQKENGNLNIISGKQIKEDLFVLPQPNISDYIINQSYNIIEILPQIKNEL